MTEKKDNVVAFAPKEEVAATDTLSQENPNAMPSPITPLTILKDKLGISPETVAKLERAEDIITELEGLLDTTLADYTVANFKEQHERDISIPMEALTRTLGHVTKEMDNLIPQEDLVNFEHHANLRKTLSEAINQAMSDVVEAIDGPVFAQDLYLSLIIVLSSHMNQHRIHSFHKIFDLGQGFVADPKEDNVSDETDNI